VKCLLSGKTAKKTGKLESPGKTGRNNMGSQCKYIAPVCSSPVLFGSRVLCYSVGSVRSNVFGRLPVLNNSMRPISGTLRPMLLPWLSGLSHVEPPALKCKTAVAKANIHHAWPLNNDLLHPPQHWLKLRMLLRSDMESVASFLSGAMIVVRIRWSTVT